MDSDQILRNIMNVYNESDCPFVIGYSGGKDSTAVLDFFLQALHNLYAIDESSINKTTYIISSDTLVENPLSTSLVNETFESLKKYEVIYKLKLIKVNPNLDNTYWVSIIGKGYPIPLNRFRWCTRQMKIDPMNKFMDSFLMTNNKYISVMGIRYDESSTRLTKMKKNYLEYGEALFKNNETQNSIIFAPIHDVLTKDLWNYLLKRKKTYWGLDLGILYELYWDTSKECPMTLESSVLDDNSSNCGLSRWGCWTCPMSSTIWLDNMVNNGLKALRPMAELRKSLNIDRDRRENRYLGKHIINHIASKVRVTIGSRGLTKLKAHTNEKNIFFQPKKDYRKKITYKLNNDYMACEDGKTYKVISKIEFEDMIENKNILLFNETGAFIDYIIYYNEEYWIPSVGPYTLSYRFKILDSLLNAQLELNEDELNSIGISVPVLINKEEVQKIFYYWRLLSEKIQKRKLVDDFINKIETKYGGLIYGNEENSRII